MKRFEFVLRIEREDYLRYYRGEAHAVVVEAIGGQTVQFPASRLRPFVTDGGIAGRFLLLCDEANRCLELRRLS